MTVNIDELELQLTADGSYTLKHPRFPETYHSRFGAVTEATMVFLENSTVKHRLQQRQETSVLEIGFGSGLNFLLTARCARYNQCRLHYTAYENQLPPIKLITTLLRRNTSDCEGEITSVQNLLAAGNVQRAPVNSFSKLTLCNADVSKNQIVANNFDAVYLDAFSITQNPQLWQAEFLILLHQALKPNGKLATYSVNRSFKDALTTAGFEWQKIAGPAGKREVIVATAI